MTKKIRVLTESDVRDLASEESAFNKDLGYNYPMDLDLKPGSELHIELLNRLIERAEASYSEMENRHPIWKEIDRTLTAYIPAKMLEKGAENLKTSRSVIMPVSYAMMDTLLSQMTTTFLDSPIMKYSGTEDIIGAILLEKVIEIQTLKLKTGLALHTLYRDSLAYGFGVSSPSWFVKTGKRVVSFEREVTADEEIFNIRALLGLPEENSETPKKRKLIDDVLFEGTDLLSIDPYRYMPDPTVPIDRPQDGEFVGWISPSNYFNLLLEEQSGKSNLFNVRYLKLKPFDTVGRSALFGELSRNEKSGVGVEDRAGSKSDLISDLDTIAMFVKLIPKDWNLGDSEKVSYWEFRIAGDNVIIKAKPLEFPFDSMFPVAVLAPEYDGHSIVPISKIEVNYGVQEHIDFLISSHFENVKRAVNDIIIYDPTVINSRDVNNPIAGGRWRTRRGNFNKNIRDSVFQLPIQDVTRPNMTDAMMMTEFAYRGLGANEQLQGIMRTKGERVSAEEASGTKVGSLTRIDRSIRVASLQVMIDLAYIYGANTQYYMDKGLWVDLTGQWERELRAEFGKDGKERVYVDPSMITVGFDVIPHDTATLRSDNPQAWIQLLQLRATDPELLMKISGVRTFLHVARLLGAKNASEFQRTQQEIQALKAQIMPDQQVEKEAQAGNIVPVGG